MEVNFIKDIIIHKKENNCVDVDISAIFFSIVTKGKFDINNLSEDDKDDIILEFDSNYGEYIEKSH